MHPLKHPVLLLVLLLFSMPGLAQKHINTTRLDSDLVADSIAFHYQHYKLIVEAEVNGVRGRYLIDTGAPMVISETLYEQLKPKTLYKRDVSDANGQRHKTRYVKIDKLKLGTTSFSNITALVLDLKKIPLGCFELDGMIGSNVFHELVVHFNWQIKTMVLAKERSVLGLTKSDFKKIKFKSYQKTPLVKLGFSNITTNAIIDTGSGGFFSVSNNVLPYGKAKNTIVEQANGAATFGVFGYNLDSKYYLLDIDSATINGVGQIKAQVTTSTDKLPKLGMKLLEKSNLTIDYKKGGLIFNLTEPINRPFYTYGFELAFDGNSLIVGSVWEGSEAENKGIRPGDTIMKINDFILEEEEVCSNFFKIGGMLKEQDTIKVSFKKSTGIETIEFKKTLY